MTKNWIREPRHIVALLFLVLTSFLTVDIVGDSRVREVYAFDLAELDHVKHGLLNANRWARIGSLLASRKIDEFQFTERRRQDLLPLIETSLQELVVEIRRTLAAMSWAKRKLASWVLDNNLDQKKIPEVAKKILAKIETKLRDPQTRRQLKSVLAAELENWERTTAHQIDQSLLRDFLARHGCTDRPTCRQLVLGKLSLISADLKYTGIGILTLVILIFLVVLTSERPYGSVHIGMLLAACLTLWLGGILTPMLAVEAKIAELNFLIAGEPVSFKEQLIFYQSKSIVDFVWTLVQTGSVEMVIVGALIGLFSVVFPAIKMSASLAYLYDYRGLRTNRVLRFFALKSGKWSMADVMVVAIFMAFIGFSRLIDTQLAQIGGGNPNVDVLATEGTSFLIGFFLFLGFCLASMVFSTVIEGMQSLSTSDDGQGSTAE